MTVMHPMATQDNRPAGNDPRRAGTGRMRMTPGRRAALLFGVPICVALVLVTGLSLAADLGEASYPLSYTFPAAATKIAVSNEGGQLSLTQGAVDRATLTGTAHYSLIHPKPPVASINGGVASYDYRCRVPFGNCALDASLTIPRGMAASVSTDGGNLKVTGTTGAIGLSSGGGELTAQNVSGGITMHTGGGNITADNVSGTASMSSDGGDIQATTVRSEGVTASSGGGNITIAFTVVPRDVSVSTGGGDITIIVPPGSTYHIIASTDGGNVNDSTVPQSGTSRNVITATSGGGDITIRQS